MSTTSRNQRTMRRISANNPVRRRLFPAIDPIEEAKNDNFTNILRDAMARDRKEKTRKWNFDFANETPLDGPYVWYKSSDKNDWLGVKTEEAENVENTKEEESTLPIKIENESTPKVKNEGGALIRKRKKNTAEVVDKAARRRIRF